MKIGIVVDNELNNDKRVLREIQILKESGYEIFVLCLGFGKTYSDPLFGITIERINLKKKVKDILFLFLNTIPVYEWLWSSWINKFISRYGIDFLHVHDLYMAKAANSGIKKANKDIPLVLDLHENYPFAVTTYNWTKGFFRSLISRPQDWQKKEKEYLEFADRIIVLSYDFRDLLISRYPELSIDSFTALPNVPDLSQKEIKENVSLKNLFENDFPVLFYYGVIAERRGVFDALNVFTELVKENCLINFLFIGPVDKKDKIRFTGMINSDTVANRIHYIPWIESDELSAYLEVSDICIAPFHKNPQHESGVANKIYDYMLGAKPIIASDCLPQQKLIEKHNCGLVFRNMEELHDSIIRLAGDNELRRSMGKNGYEAIIKEYNINSVKENLLRIYDNYGALHLPKL
jgi:glycosyltransferase involved in cell wall biosynthesis